jgi:HK97 family phage prohead protease
METKMRLKDYIQERSDRAERRYYSLPINFLEIEENGATKVDENTITGYAAVFNSDSEDLGGFIERIAPGAFTGVLQDDAWAYLNHSINHPLGRNGKNLTLYQDDRGLRYKVNLLDNTDGNNARILVRAGIIYKSSFAFIAAEEVFTKGDPSNGVPHVRTITKMERLFDVSPLSTDPAYMDTSVAARSLKKINGVDEIQKALEMQKYKFRRRKHEHNYNQLFKF